jgi:hypothetical protein
MKKLFTNYNFDFDKNEKKLITSFCKQVLKQLDSNQHFGEIKAFNSIIDKMNAGTESVKLTKDEKVRLRNYLIQNIDYLKKQMDKSWFIKKWLMKSLFKQYSNLYENYFKG